MKQARPGEILLGCLRDNSNSALQIDHVDFTHLFSHFS